jgi:signal transduction histidine kinase
MSRPLPQPPGLRPLAEGNRLQRAYARWAAPHYARLPPEAREPAELLDRFLYSRRGLGVWLGVAGSVAGTTAGLHHSGMALGVAALLAVLVWMVLPCTLLAAWLAPSRFSSQVLWRKLPIQVLLGLAGAVTGFAVARWGQQGDLSLPGLAAELQQKAGTLLPAAMIGAVTIVFLMWAVASVRRQVLERELTQAQLAQERDQAARQMAEAQLRLLRAQIQPHFIFNTLAAVQHWVDTADPRAGPLLRSLAAFLRGSTELLAREQVTLAEEATLAGHYLATMQARLGGRLAVQVDIPPALAAQTLPPGLLLTLVENAVEHGIAPALQGGTVHVQARAEGAGWQLCVCDDGAGLPAGWQAGTGLANCRQRLAHAYGEAAALSLQSGPAGRGTCARIRLPLASPVPAAPMEAQS